jgi:hypothetical protein
MGLLKNLYLNFKGLNETPSELRVLPPPARAVSRSFSRGFNRPIQVQRDAAAPVARLVPHGGTRALLHAVPRQHAREVRRCAGGSLRHGMSGFGATEFPRPI